MNQKNNYKIAKKGYENSLRNLGKLRIGFQCYLYKILQNNNKN